MSDEVPKPRRAMGGWGDETADAAGGGGGGGDKPKAGRRAGFGASENDSTANSTRRMDTTSGSRSSNNNNNREKDADDEITLLHDVPTLDMGGNEDITTVVAEAPKVRNNRVQGLAELDSAVPYQLPTTSEEGIDLTLLQSALLPQNKVDEADVQWDFDAVLNELMVEANPANEDSEEEGEEAMDKTILSMKNKQDELPQELSSQSASSSTAAASARPFSSAPTAPDKDSSSASSGNAPPVPARTGRRAARQE